MVIVAATSVLFLVGMVLWKLLKASKDDGPTTGFVGLGIETPINITGPVLSVREVATSFANLFGKEPLFEGTEDRKGWLVDASLSDEMFGPLQVPAEAMIGWLADWISNDRESLNKPTAFDSRDGSF